MITKTPLSLLKLSIISMKYVFAILVLIAAIGLVQDSYAKEIGVSIPAGTSKPGCEIKDLCYIPSPLTVEVGTVVEWKNLDSVAHTVTSGSPKDGPDGIIYSDLITPGEVFAYQFDEDGVFPYYCTLHPWKEGLVISKVSPTSVPSGDYELKELMYTQNGNIVVIQSDVPKAKNPLSLEVSFVDPKGNLLESMNYDIRIIQDGEEVMSLQNQNSQDGKREHVTKSLESDNPVDVEIGIRGIYPASQTPQAVKEVIEFQQIPEFGQITILVLVASISALVALRLKPIMKIPNM